MNCNSIAILYFSVFQAFLCHIHVWVCVYVCVCVYVIVLSSLRFHKEVSYTHTHTHMKSKERQYNYINDHKEVMLKSGIVSNSPEFQKI